MLNYDLSPITDMTYGVFVALIPIIVGAIIIGKVIRR